MMYVAEAHCARLHGGSVRECGCLLPQGGFLECPPAAKKVLKLPKLVAQPPALTGDMCPDCFSISMVRAGTCLLCLACGSTNGGCS